MNDPVPMLTLPELIQALELHAQVMELRRRRINTRISSSRASGFEPDHDLHARHRQLIKDRLTIEHCVAQLRAQLKGTEERRDAA